MNLFQLLQNWIGEHRPDSPKALEWKVGQVLQGKVMHLLDSQHAVVNLNGIRLQVRLEVPVQTGQMMLLQVQPNSSDGLIRLKPLEGSKVPITTGSIKELLQQAGLPDRKAYRELIIRMHEAGWTPEKQMLREFAPIVSAKPEHSSIVMSEWIRSGIIAKERNLPLTRTFIEPLYHLHYGTPFSQLVDNMKQQLSRLLNEQTAAANQPVSIEKLIVLANELQSLLQNLENIAPSAEKPMVPLSESSSNWLLRLFQALGFNLEQQLAHADDQLEAASPTLKSLLSQFVISDRVPQALKDSATQMLQQIIGSQLLLGAEKVNSTLHTITLVIPFYNGQGEQTASVQIHSRNRSRDKSPVDPDHCRLWFDLSMKHIGQTFIDVQVLKQAVSLVIHNDDKRVQSTARIVEETLKSSLQALGYQLMSVTTKPYTAKSTKILNTDTLTANNYEVVHNGVDIRI